MEIWGFLPSMGAYKQTAQCISLLNSAYEFNTILPTAQNSVVKPFTQRIKWDFLFQHQAGYMTESLLSLSLVIRREWFEAVKRPFSSNHGNTKQHFEEEGRLVSLGKWSVWQMVKKWILYLCIKAT